MSILYIVIGILMFGVLIAVHELGHFSVAKLFGIKVNEYAIGMGPALWSRQRGETQYSLRALPIGGFCAIEGEDGESDDPRAFTKKPLWQRLLVLFAGSFTNLLTGFLIALILYLISAFSGSYALANSTLVGFMDGFPLEGESGLQVGDRIVSVDGWRVNNPRDLTLFLSVGNGETVDLVIRRDGETRRLENFPLCLREFPDDSGGVQLRYGLYFDQTPLTALSALRESVYDCAYFSRVVWVSLRFLLTGRAGVKELTGPVGMVKAIGEAGAQGANVGEGLSNVFSLIAFIAVNLSVMNLLPIPGLDGGHIFSMLISAVWEKIFRRKPDPRIERYIHTGGLLLLLALMVFVMANDIYRLF